MGEALPVGRDVGLDPTERWLAPALRFDSAASRRAADAIGQWRWRTLAGRTPIARHRSTPPGKRRHRFPNQPLLRGLSRPSPGLFLRLGSIRGRLGYLRTTLRGKGSGARLSAPLGGGVWLGLDTGRHAPDIHRYLYRVTFHSMPPRARSRHSRTKTSVVTCQHPVNKGRLTPPRIAAHLPGAGSGCGLCSAPPCRHASGTGDPWQEVRFL